MAQPDSFATTQRPVTPDECLRIIRARLWDHLSPAEKRELEEAATLLQAYFPQSGTLSESTGASEGYPGIAHDLETMRTALGTCLAEMITLKARLSEPYRSNIGAAIDKARDALKNAAPQSPSCAGSSESAVAGQAPAAAAPEANIVQVLPLAPQPPTVTTATDGPKRFVPSAGATTSEDEAAFLRRLRDALALVGLGTPSSGAATSDLVQDVLKAIRAIPPDSVPDIEKAVADMNKVSVAAYFRGRGINQAESAFLEVMKANVSDRGNDG